MYQKTHHYEPRFPCVYKLPIKGHMFICSAAGEILYVWLMYIHYIISLHAWCYFLTSGSRRHYSLRPCVFLDEQYRIAYDLQIKRTSEISTSKLLLLFPLYLKTLTAKSPLPIESLRAPQRLTNYSSILIIKQSISNLYRNEQSIPRHWAKSLKYIYRRIALVWDTRAHFIKSSKIRRHVCICQHFCLIGRNQYSLTLSPKSSLRPP